MTTRSKRQSKTTNSPSLSESTWYVVRGTSDIYWRAEVPAKNLGSRLVDMRPEDAGFTEPNEDSKFPWRLEGETAYYPEHKGTAVWTRPDMTRAIHACAMSAQGIRVVAEVDDNYISNPRHNIFMRHHGFDAETRKRHMKAFATMDGIICSTDWLRDEYTKAFKKELGYVPEMFVARNHVDLDDWREPVRTWDRIRVGIMGSMQHVFDWRLAAPALHLAKQLGAELVFIGLDPADSDPGWRDFLGDYTQIPWLDPDDYHKTGLPLDIGLCPLVTNKHTMGKSDLKFLEYSMSGIATVAQNNVVYNRTMRHGETGLLAGSPDEMAVQVAELIRNPGLRERLVTAAQQYVREERTIQGNLHEWKEAIWR